MFICLENHHHPLAWAFCTSFQLVLWNEGSALCQNSCGGFLCLVKRNTRRPAISTTTQNSTGKLINKTHYKSSSFTFSYFQFSVHHKRKLCLFVHTLTITLTHTQTHLDEIREPKTKKKQSVNTAALRFFCASEFFLSKYCKTLTLLSPVVQCNCIITYSVRKKG